MLSAWAYTLPYHPSMNLDGERQGWVLRLGSGPEAGWAEACPLPQWGSDDVANTRSALAHALASGEDLEELLALDDLSQVFEAWNLDPKLSPCATAALELCYWDGKARAQGHSLAAELAKHLPGGVPQPAESILVNALVSAISPEAVGAEVEAAVAAGHQAVKLKVGGRSIAEDLARAKAARKALGAKRELRLDANGAWGHDEALAALKSLASTKAAYVEQPVAAGDDAAFLALASASPMALAADESLVDSASAMRLIDSGALAAVVLKPALLGGFGVSAQLAAAAKAKGMRVILTGAQDRGVATLAAAHLAAALGLDGPHGLCMPRQFDDPSPPVQLTIEKGQLHLSGPGLGLVVRPEIKPSPSPAPRGGRPAWGRR